MNNPQSIVLLVSTVLAGVASVFVLLLYRRAVRRVMLSILNAPVQEDPYGLPANRPPLPLTDAKPAPLYDRMRRRQRLALAIHLLAGAAATLILASAMNLEGSVLKALGACAFGLGPVLALAGTGKRRIARSLTVALVLVLFFAARRLSEVWPQFLTAVELFVPAIIFFVLVMNRYLKTVAPMLLKVAVGAVAGVELGRAAADYMALGAASYAAVVLVISFAGVAAGILALQRTVRAYKLKRTNDQLLLLDTYWLLVMVNLVARIGEWWALLIAVPAFLAYRGVLRLFHWRVEAYALRHGAVELLLLRTFGSRQRSERLMEEIGFHWRFIGPIHLIDGSDLATANLDPAELWQFLRGRTADLAMNAATDVKPDRDGRYRVNNFLCFDDTWRATVTSLVDRSHVILLDARDFLARNEGVKTELRHLLARKPLESLVVIVDSEHEPALRAAIEEAWQCVDASSVNVLRGGARLCIVRVDGRNVDASRVLRALAEAAESQPMAVGAPILAAA